jgi:hypothetical protein
MTWEAKARARHRLESTRLDIDLRTPELLRKNPEACIGHAEMMCLPGGTSAGLAAGRPPVRPAAAGTLSAVLTRGRDARPAMWSIPPGPPGLSWCRGRDPCLSPTGGCASGAAALAGGATYAKPTDAPLAESQGNTRSDSGAQARRAPGRAGMGLGEGHALAARCARRRAGGVLCPEGKADLLHTWEEPRSLGGRSRRRTTAQQGAGLRFRPGSEAVAPRCRCDVEWTKRHSSVCAGDGDAGGYPSDRLFI